MKKFEMNNVTVKKDKIFSLVQISNSPHAKYQTSGFGSNTTSSKKVFDWKDESLKLFDQYDEAMRELAAL